MARPSVSDERIELLPDDNVRIKLRTAWSDGSTHIELSALETMENLVALVPLPKFHLLRYYAITLLQSSLNPCKISLKNSASTKE